MNRIHRLVFNRALGQVQVASELVSGAGSAGTAGHGNARWPRTGLLGLALLLACGSVSAASNLPVGFSSGDASYVTNGTVTQITQNGAKALISWSDFSIGDGYSVQFQQGGAQHVALNVVTSNIPSQIDGSLVADGGVFIINPNGILFGANASVDVGSLVASTLPLTLDSDPVYTFNRGGAPASALVNRGMLKTASGGSVTLIGPAIANQGTVIGDTVNLAAGDGVILNYIPQLGVTASVTSTVKALPPGVGTVVDNTGAVMAGQLTLQALVAQGLASAAINMGGNIQATRLDARGQNGALLASGTVQADEINVSSNREFTQSAGSLSGHLTADVVGAVSLTSAGNRLSGIGGTVDGALTLNNTTALTQDRALEVTGTTDISNDGQAITLLDAGNRFGDTVKLSGGAIRVAAPSLVLGTVDATSLDATATTLQLTDDIATSGDQTYHGTTLLGAGATVRLSANDARIAFDGTLDGAGNLTIDNTGTTAFDGTVGGAIALDTLAVNGGTVALAGEVTTQGNLAFDSDVRLVADSDLHSRAGSVALGGSVDGPANLSVQAATRAQLAGVGAVTPLANLAVTGGEIVLGGSITTTGAQTYMGSTRLDAATVLTSTGAGGIGFDGTLDGGYALAINTAGSTRFDGAVGGITPLASLATDTNGSTLLGGDVTATGAIGFGDGLLLSGDTAVRSIGGAVAFERINGGYDLFVGGSTGTTFGGDVAVRGLRVDNVGPGRVRLQGDITALDRIDLMSAVDVDGSVVLDAAGIGFAQTVDGNGSLSLRSAGIVSVGGNIGSVTPLGGLDVEAAGLSAQGIRTGGDLSIDVAGAITQSGAFRVGGAARFIAGSGMDVRLSNSGNAFTGTVSASGQLVSITSSTALTLDQVQAGSDLVARSFGGRLVVGNATVGAGGARLSGAYDVDLGPMQVAGDLSVNANQAITQHGALQVAGTSSFSTIGQPITLTEANAFVGAVSLEGSDVGIAAIAPLALGAVDAVNLSASAPTLRLGSAVTTTGYQRYQGALALSQDTVLNAGGTVDILGDIDGDAALDIQASGLTAIEGQVGQHTALRALSVSGPSRLAGAVTTTGDQSFGGAITLSGDTALTSTAGNLALGDASGAHGLSLTAAGQVAVATLGAIDPLRELHIAAPSIALGGNAIATTGAQRYQGAVLLGRQQTLSSRDGGDIVFENTVDGGHALAINTAGRTRFDGDVGGSAFLAALSTDAAGSTSMAGTIATLNDITLNDAVSLDGASHLQSLAGAVRLGQAVTGAHALRVQGATGSLFGGPVNVASLVVQGGGTTSLGGDVTVATDAAFGQPLRLTGDVTVRGANLSFAGAIDGPHALGLRATGAVAVGGDIGATDALRALDIDAASFAGRAITTTGGLALDTASDLVQGGAYRVGGDARFTAGGDITLLDAGNRFDGQVAVSGEDARLWAQGDLQLQQVRLASLQAGAGGRVDLGDAAIAGVAALQGTAIGFDQAHVGDLSVTTSGAIGQSGALTVAGNSQLSAGGDIVLAGAGNRFAGTLDATGQAITIVAAGDLYVTRLANGVDAAVELQAGGALAVDAAIDTGTAALGLTAQGGALRSSGALAGGQVALAGRDGIDLGGDVSAGTLSLTSPGGRIGQRAGRVSVAGATQVDAGAGEIVLASADNHFGGAVQLRGGATTLRATDALQLAGATTARLDARAANGLTVTGATIGGNATLDAGNGALVLADGVIDGDLVATGVAIDQQGTWRVAGTAELGATTTLALHDVGAGQLQAQAGGGLSVARARVARQAVLQAGNGALVLGDVQVGGDMQAAGASIRQAGALDVSGNASLASGGDLQLDGATFGGLRLDAGGLAQVAGIAVDADARLSGAGGLSMQDLRIGGDLQASGATIAQTGALGVGGTATLDSPGAISLASVKAGNLLASAGNGLDLGQASISGDASLAAGNAALALGTVQVGGDLRASGATIAQTGALGVGGTATLDSPGAISLASVEAGNLLASAGDGLDLGQASISGDASLAAGNAALALGTVQVGGDLQASGATIAQTGALRVGVRSRLESRAALRLDRADNAFGGTVALQGGDALIAAQGDLALDQVEVASLQAGSSGALRLAGARIAGPARLAGNGVTLADLRVGGDLDIASGQGIAQDSAIQVGGASRLTSAAALVLDHAGNDFQGAVSLDGRGIRLVDANDLQVVALGNRGVGPASALRAQPLAGTGADVTLIAGGQLSLPTQAVDLGAARLDLRANGGPLAVRSSLAAGDIRLEGRDGLTLAADVSATGSLALHSAGVIQQLGGRLSATELTGHAGAAATLTGDNRIAALGDFTAGSLSLANAASLVLAGDVQAGASALLDVRGGDLQLDGRLAAQAVRLQATGAITQGATGQLATGALSGRAGGATRLGDAGGFIDNHVGRLGDFSAAGGFSLTNAGTLTLAAINGSAYTVDAGDASFFLHVDGGDLLQEGSAPVYAGVGHWGSSGRIGTAQAPIYVVTEQPTQVVDFVGLPPAYFYAVHPDGSPVNIAGAINVPTTAVAVRAQSGTLHRVAYVDVGALDAQYRAFGIVQPGIRLPADQIQACDSGDPDADCTP